MGSWEEKFRSSEYVYGEKPNEFIRCKASELETCRSVVLFAEGEGRNAVFLAQEGHDVTAWDNAESGLEKTSRLAEKKGVTVHVQNVDLVEDNVPEDAFDAAVMVFGHFPEEYQKKVFDKMLRTIRPGGVLMLEVYSKDQISYGTGGPRETGMLYDPIEILRWSRPYQIRHFFCGEQVREEGKFHTGLAHVIQLILVKK